MTTLTVPLPLDVTPTGIPAGLPDLADVDLALLMRHLDAVSGAVGWAMGDVLIEALARLRSGDGSGIPAEAWPSHQAGASRAVQVALIFPPETRRQTLTWAHHDLVAHRDDRDRMLDTAEAEAMSVAALRAYCRQVDEDRRPQLDGMPPKPWRPPARVAADLAALWQADPAAVVVLRSSGEWELAGGAVVDATGREA